jgi:hypothetical protein
METIRETLDEWDVPKGEVSRHCARYRSRHAVGIPLYRDRGDPGKKIGFH